MSAAYIPFVLPFTGSEEIEAAASALRAGHLHGDGPITNRVQGILRELTRAKHALLTTSGSHALELAALLADLGPGDEVILPSFTFTSTANAVVLRGARPVFAEIEIATLNIDPDDIERCITPRTRAVMPVHYAGVACDMDRIQAIAARHDLRVIEDAAQGIDAYHKGRALGTLGDIGCLSFHGTKNVTCGEGGAILTNDEEVARRAEIVREKGTNRSAFFRGDVDKYGWVEPGSSYVPSDVLVAILEVQLARLGEIRHRRRIVAAAYRKALQWLTDEGHIRFGTVPEYADPNDHIFFFLVSEPGLRDSVIASVREAGLHATFHYTPLHVAPWGAQFAPSGGLPVTELCADSLVRLPLFPGIADQAEEVAERAAGAVRRGLRLA